jgi:chitinase
MTADAPKLIRAAHAAGVKVIFSIVNPYWMDQKRNLPEAVARHRAELVENIARVVNTYGYDGVNIDWEGAPPDVGALAADLKATLGAKPLMADAIVTDYRYWGGVQARFDRVNIMTYDLTGTWNPYLWHNSALRTPDDAVWSIELAVQRFTRSGVPAAKLGIGIPLFGYRWTGGGVAAPKEKWRSEPKLAQIHYNAIVPLISRGEPKWDPVARVPFLSGPGWFMTYDDPRSVAEKVRFARENRLGGWILWNLSMDYMPSARQKHPLLAAIAEARR